jgi:hypothetical protein
MLSIEAPGELTRKTILSVDLGLFKQTHLTLLEASPQVKLLHEYTHQSGHSQRMRMTHSVQTTDDIRELKPTAKRHHGRKTVVDADAIYLGIAKGPGMAERMVKFVP